MSISKLNLRRLAGVERRVIQIVRGDRCRITTSRQTIVQSDFSGTSAELEELRQAQFGVLRRCLERNGLKLLSPGASFITPDEKCVLRWLAEAQREAGLRTLCSGDRALWAAFRQSGDILRRMGLLLPSATLTAGADMIGDLQLYEPAPTHPSGREEQPATSRHMYRVRQAI